MRRLLFASVTAVLLCFTGFAMPAMAVDDENCDDFDSQEEAQAHLNRTWPADPDQLDRENDGWACEGYFGYKGSVPNAKNQQPDPTATTRPDTPTPVPANTPVPTATTGVTPDPTANVTPSPTGVASTEAPAPTDTPTEPPSGTPVPPDDQDNDTGGTIDNNVESQDDAEHVTELPTTGTGEQGTGMAGIMVVVALICVAGAVAYRSQRTH